MQEDFNIFNLLSSGNKELVHTSMLQFLWETEKLGLHQSFFKSTKDKKEITLLKEKSVSIKINGVKKRLRFDLVSSDYDFLLENKFKATPTRRQLELYDRFLADNKQDGSEKFLFVLYKNQVTQDVKAYCEDFGWQIKSYIGIDEQNDSLLSYLTGLKYKGMLSSEKEFLIKQYIAYLENVQANIQELVEDGDGLYKIKKYIGKGIMSVREKQFHYLLHIQSEISKSLKEKGVKEYDLETTNDGGANVVPSIAFWQSLTNKDQIIKSLYFGIDGDTMKIGVEYRRKDGERLRDMIREIGSSNMNGLKSVKQNKQNIDRIKKGKKNDNKTSVYSLATYTIKENQKKNDVVEDAVKIIRSYFADMKNFSSDNQHIGRKS